MINKQQWILLPADMIKRMFGLQLSLIGLVPQTNRGDRMISDYSYFDVNANTFNIAPAEAMQFGRTLSKLLYRIHHVNSHFGPVYMSTVDLSLMVSTASGCVQRAHINWQFFSLHEKMNLLWWAFPSPIQWGGCHLHRILQLAQKLYVIWKMLT